MCSVSYRQFLICQFVPWPAVILFITNFEYRIWQIKMNLQQQGYSGQGAPFPTTTFSKLFELVPGNFSHKPSELFEPRTLLACFSARLKCMTRSLSNQWQTQPPYYYYYMFYLFFFINLLHLSEVVIWSSSLLVRLHFPWARFRIYTHSIFQCILLALNPRPL